MVFAPLPAEWLTHREQRRLVTWLCGVWFCGFLLMAVAVWWRCYRTSDRIHWIEIHEMDWCPRFFQNTVRLYVKSAWDMYGFGIVSGSAARTVGSMLFDLLGKYGWINSELEECVSELNFVDLCAGGGGPSTVIHRSLKKQMQQYSMIQSDGNKIIRISTILTDLFPVPSHWQQLKDRHSDLSLHYCSDPVNALKIGNADVLGSVSNVNTSEDCDDDNNCLTIRTMYGSFHHFRPHQTIELISDAMFHGHGFFMAEPVLFRGSPMDIIKVLLLVVIPLPFATLGICVELWRDSNMSILRRLLNCWMVIITMPITVSLMCHDGIISCARSYTASQLSEIVKLAEIAAKKRIEEERRQWSMDYDFEINDWDHAEVALLTAMGLGRMTVLAGLPRRKGVIPHNSEHQM